MSMIKNDDLFGVAMPGGASNDHLTVMPVSVIEIAAQKKREGENHGSTSSRANYSPFPAEIAILCYEFYLRDCEFIFDPFAGWGERAAFAAEYGKQYIGYDTSESAIASAKDKYRVENHLADSASAFIPPFEGLITCPPYWNLERYDGDGLDRIKTWEQFRYEYAELWERVYSAASPGATFCVMVGEWRKGHKYYDLEFLTRRVSDDLGAEIFDQVVVSRRTVSKIKIMLPQAKRLGYSVRVHESLLVFKKPETGAVSP